MYQALYRKWRPSDFTEVYGQDHITATLQNELKSGRISHAYLFVGSRGTGKTSCAKILSKAVNCPHTENGNPCGKCEICTGIDNGSITDVVEIDAASNNSVEDIRDLRDQVNYTPVNCKYRVYIIDEVHMLSSGAFNALLKTLEEPPAHVLFILATTEIQKLPATILSRCQRFDFKRISSEAISERLKEIAQGEGVEITDDAAALIARLADGGMRDAVSLLDRCCARDNFITGEVVTAAAGIAGTAHLFEFSKNILENNFTACIELVNRLHAEACDIESLCSELINHFRNLMIAKTVQDCAPLIICPSEELEEYKKTAAAYRISKILDCLDILESTSAVIKYSVYKKVHMESAVIKMCSINEGTAAAQVSVPETSAPTGDVSALLQRIEGLESRIASLSAAQLSTAHRPAEKPVRREPEPVKEQKIDTVIKPVEPRHEEPAPLKEEKPAETAVPAEPAPAKREYEKWAEVIEILKKRDMPLAAMLEGTTAYVSKGTHLVIRTDNPILARSLGPNEPAAKTHIGELLRAVSEVTGEKLKIGVKESTPKEEKKNPLEGLIKKIDEFNSENQEE